MFSISSSKTTQKKVNLSMYRHSQSMTDGRGALLLPPDVDPDAAGRGTVGSRFAAQLVTLQPHRLLALPVVRELVVRAGGPSGSSIVAW